MVYSKQLAGAERRLPQTKISSDAGPLMLARYVFQSFAEHTNPKRLLSHVQNIASGEFKR